MRTQALAADTLTATVTQPGALPASALEQVIDGVRGLDPSVVRAEVAAHPSPSA